MPPCLWVGYMAPPKWPGNFDQSTQRRGLNHMKFLSLLKKILLQSRTYFLKTFKSPALSKLEKKKPIVQEKLSKKPSPTTSQTQKALSFPRELKPKK